MRTMKHWAIAAMTAAALALAGCGGGGSSGGTQSMTDQKPTPAELATTASGLLDTAENAVDLVMDDSDAATVTTAEMAVAAAETAVMAAKDADNHSDLTKRLGMLQGSLGEKNSSRQTAMTKANEVAGKATTATAKALKKAIDLVGVAPAVTNATIPAFDLDGAGDGTTESTAISLKKGDSAGMLGSWDGTDYAGMNGTGTAKTTGMYRRYSNQEEAKSVSFASEAGEMVHELPRYVPAEDDSAGDYALTGTGATATTAGDPDVSTEIDGFPTTGTHDYEEDDTVTGTYMGGAGTYKCVAADGCMSNAEGTAGIDLSAGWTFTPTGGSMVQDKDGEYLHFGWWIRKDSKDAPTHAGVLYGMTGATLVDNTTINSANLVGPAKYVGKAAGKFAISDPLRPGEDNAGHFTADAELTADFKETESTLKGTIDEFRLNDGSTNPGWSVELQMAMFQTGNSFGTDATPDGDQTVWSIGGNKGAAAGSWEAQMYDDKAADDTNVPNSVVGSFNAEISTTHSMVGAFGAEKTE